MRLVIIMVTVIFIENSVQKVQFYQEDTPSSVRNRFVESALLSYYEETRNVIVFARKSSALQQFSPTVPLLLFSELDALMKAISEKAGTLIVILNGFTKNEDLHDLEQLQSVRTKYPVLVICDTTAACSSRAYLETISKATNSPLLHYLIVVGEGLIQIFQRTETAERSCGVSRLVRIAYNSQDAWPTAKTFSMALNFNKCPLRLAVQHTPWYAERCKPSDSHLFCGYEGSLIASLINKINATPVTTEVKSAEQVKDLVATGQADVGYGWLYNDNNQAIAYSCWYQFIKLAFSVPITASGFGGPFSTIALPFEPEVWIGLAVSMVTMLILGKLVPDFRRIQPLQQFSLIIGVSVPTQPRRLSRRIYFISIVLFGFWFSQLYLVNLTKIYSSFRPYEITTLEEVEKLGLPVYGREIGREVLIESGYSRIAENYKVLSVPEIAAKVGQIDQGKTSDILHLESDPESRALMQNVNDIDQAVKWYTLALVAPNSSPIMKAMNEIIVAKLESKILKRFDNGLLDASASRKKRIQRPKKLSINDLQGVFSILAGGLPLSILLFVVEVAHYFLKKKLNSTRWAQI